MRKIPIAAAVAGALACAALPAQSDEGGMNVRFSGFGTVSGVSSDTDQVEYTPYPGGQPNGVEKGWSWDIDTRSEHRSMPISPIDSLVWFRCCQNAMRRILTSLKSNGRLSASRQARKSRFVPVALALRFIWCPITGTSITPIRG